MCCVGGAAFFLVGSTLQWHRPLTEWKAVTDYSDYAARFLMNTGQEGGQSGLNPEGFLEHFRLLGVGTGTVIRVPERVV